MQPWEQDDNCYLLTFFFFTDGQHLIWNRQLIKNRPEKQWETWNHPHSMTDPTWQRSAKMNLSYLWLEGGCADSTMPVWNSNISKGTEREADLLYKQVCVCTHEAVCVCNGKTHFNILKRFPPPISLDWSKPSLQHQRHKADSLSQQRNTVSDCCKSAPGSPLLRSSVSMFRVLAFKF